MPLSRKSDPARRPRRVRAVESPSPEPLPTEPPPVEPPPSAPGDCTPWGVAAVRVPYRGGYILAAPGTDPAPLIKALDEHRQPRDWAALGADLAALGPHRIRIAMLIARAVLGRGVSPEEDDQLAAWLTRIIVELVARAGGVYRVIAWISRAGLREVASC
ncbi:MAG TPA: hypothetical protein VN253_29560 [Kofleriaceae bacterium]|nr:hypothetical protein [Kofleriaceae bacterium]